MRFSAMLSCIYLFIYLCSTSFFLREDNSCLPFLVLYITMIYYSWVVVPVVAEVADDDAAVAAVEAALDFNNVAIHSSNKVPPSKKFGTFVVSQLFR